MIYVITGDTISSAHHYRDNPLVHLNYAVLLYNAGDLRAAAKHYAQYEKSQKGSVDSSDSEVRICSLGKDTFWEIADC